MNTLDELEELKELVNDDKKFKYKNIVNFNCDGIKEELEYADKMHKLEKQLGCPLEVYVRATIEGIKVDGSMYKVKVRKDNYGYYFALSNGSAFPFYLSSYKKTWWLKEDKSE